MNHDQPTVASNPGRVPFELLTYWRCYPKQMLLPVGLLGLGVVLLVMAVMVDGFSVVVGLIALVFGAIVLITEEGRMSKWMASGDTCPAIVLDADSGLIAVWADMTTTIKQSFPAIKVLHTPIHRSGVPLQDDQRLAVVCTFLGVSTNPHWDDVKPVPVICATRNREAIERTLASIPEVRWAEFAKDLAHLENPTPGAHFFPARSLDAEALAEQMADRIIFDQQFKGAAQQQPTSSGASYAFKLTWMFGASLIGYVVVTVLMSIQMEKTSTDGSIKAFELSGLVFGLVLASPAFLSVASLGLTTMPQEFFEETRIGRKLVEFVGGGATPSGVKSVCLVAGLFFFAITVGLYYVLQGMAAN